MSEEHSPSDNRPKSKNKAKKKKVRNRRHRHIGPNARAMRSGLAFCPMCDGQKLEAKRKTREERD